MSAHPCKTRGPGSTSEATLFRQAQHGNREALNRLMVRHDRLVQALIHRHGGGPLAYADALHAGRLGLWRAIRRFDPTRGFAFSTYAWTCIRRQVWQTVKAQTRAQAPRLPAPVTLSQAVTDPTLHVEQSAVDQVVDDLVRRLPARLQSVIVAHYGLDGDAPANFAQIGRTRGVSRERVRQLHHEALRWLRQPAHSQTLRSLLGRHTLADYQAWATLDRGGGHAQRGRHAE
jgi:RNA polymerase sigma factor (sigma-70 family)